MSNTKPITVIGVDNTGVVYSDDGKSYDTEAMNSFEQQRRFNLDRLTFGQYREFVTRYFHTPNTLVVTDKVE